MKIEPMKVASVNVGDKFGMNETRRTSSVAENVKGNSQAILTMRFQKQMKALHTGTYQPRADSVGDGSVGSSLQVQGVGHKRGQRPQQNRQGPPGPAFNPYDARAYNPNASNMTSLKSNGQPTAHRNESLLPNAPIATHRIRGISASSIAAFPFMNLASGSKQDLPGTAASANDPSNDYANRETTPTQLQDHKQSTTQFFHRRSASTLQTQRNRSKDASPDPYYLTARPAGYRKGQMMQQVDIKNPNMFISRKATNLKNYYRRKNHYQRIAEQSQGAPAVFENFQMKSSSKGQSLHLNRNELAEA